MLTGNPTINKKRYGKETLIIVQGNVRIVTFIIK
jgi:hypothetical protein